MIRAGLRKLIDSHDGLRVVGELGHTDEPIGVALQEHADVALLDLDGEDTCDEYTDLLSALVKKVRVIILSEHVGASTVLAVFHHGAMGVVLKHHPPEVLFKAITKVHGGEVWLERSMVAYVLANWNRATEDDHGGALGETSSLKRRDRQVVALVGEGLRNREIAQRLHISESTVRNCLTSIFKKLGLGGRFHLLAYAHQHGLLDGPPIVGSLVPSAEPRLLQLPPRHAKTSARGRTPP